MKGRERYVMKQEEEIRKDRRNECCENITGLKRKLYDYLPSHDQIHRVQMISECISFKDQGSSIIPDPRLIWTHLYTRQLSDCTEN